MSSIRNLLDRLAREVVAGMVSVPQKDGSVLRFTEGDLEDAFLCAYRRSLGEDVPVHPACVAAKNSSDPEWRNSVFVPPDEVPEPPEDLSE